MRRYLSAAIVTALAALAAALPAYAASAVLTVGSSGGSAVAPGDVIWGDLKGTAVFANTANGNRITCTQSRIDATDNTNPWPPGPATLSITSWTFGNCTTNFGATVTSITFDHLPYNLSVSSPNGGNNVTISPGSNGNIHLTITLVEIFQIKCQYKVHDSSGDLFGTTSNVNNSLTFTNQQFDLDVGSSLCIQHWNFSAAYTLTDHTQSGGPVFVN